MAARTASASVRRSAVLPVTAGMVQGPGARDHRCNLSQNGYYCYYHCYYYYYYDCDCDDYYYYYCEFQLVARRLTT